jgi:hypothetical protein
MVARVRQSFMLDGGMRAGICNVLSRAMPHQFKQFSDLVWGEHPSDAIIWDHCCEFGADGVTFGEMRRMAEVFHCGQQPSMGE